MTPVFESSKAHRIVFRDEETNPEYPWASVTGQGRYTDDEVDPEHLRQVWP